VVAKLSAKDISKLIKKGKAVIKTAGDRIIIAAMKGKDVFYFEEKGGKFNATIAAVK
jgi:CRISPR/Cas system-associated endoribonuclease Cas2